MVKMRFYLKRVGNGLTITNRGTHELMGFASMDSKKESVALIKKMCEMTDEEYIQYCLGLGVRFQLDYSSKSQFRQDPENERWYEGAWKQTTLLALKELGLKADIIPADTITVAMVDAVRKEGIVAKNKKALPKKVEDKPELKPVKKDEPKEETVVKKLLPKKETKPQYKSKDEVREAYAKKQITQEQYKELMRSFSKPLPKK
jgi:hypothetical protein